MRYSPIDSTSEQLSTGGLLRAARRRAGLSQAALAARAGTTQSSISRIEADRISPTISTLESLLALLGERLALHSERIDFGIDRALLNANLDLDPGARLSRGTAFAALIGRNRGAARR